ncbi:MAG: hypothetical protein K9I85_03580 [Saprospiraceae bacterium]|nr:hypothetical protein [Saprospiraceae bacterium]
MGNISWPYPWWYILGCLAIGLLVAGILYYRTSDFQERKAWVRWLLAALRALVVTLLAILLLSPLIKREESELHKPVIVIAQDASSSISNAKDGAQLIQDLEQLRSDLSRDFDIQVYAFGQAVRPEFDPTFADQETDLDAILTYIRDVLGQENLGGIVLATDGLYNKGANPRYSRNVATIPVFPVAVGDPTPMRDIGIKRIFHNQVAYQGDKFQVQIDIQGRNCQGARTELVISEIRDGKPVVLQKEPVGLESDIYFKTIETLLEAGRAGVHHYRFSLQPISDEKNIANNTRDIYIEILDARQKVLIIADAPHPDLTALKQSLSADRNYQVELRYGKDPGKGLREYDLIILHQIPSNRQLYADLLQEVKHSRIPLWFILGGQSDLRTLPAWQGILEIRGDGRSTNEVQAIIEKNFSVFTLESDLYTQLPQFPPMLAPFGDYRADPGGRTLLRQRIGAVSTEYPLWILGEEQGVKMAVLAGEGLWKWRLFDHLQHGNQEILDELIRKTVQFLSLKEDKRRFRVTTSRQVFAENEPVLFDGELYNDNYELVNDPDAQVVLKDQDGKVYPFTMNKAGKIYALQAGLFPPGNYSYKAKTTLDLKDLTYDGKFSIREVNVEQVEMQADHDLLQGLAAESGGKMVLASEIQSLADQIRGDQRMKPILFTTMETKPAIHLRWIFGILLVLLAIEWIVRRYLGKY